MEEKTRITETLSFKDGLSRLSAVIAKLPNDDIATAFTCAFRYAFLKSVDYKADTNTIEMLKGLTPTARVLFDLMDVLMDVGTTRWIV